MLAGATLGSAARRAANASSNDTVGGVRRIERRTNHGPVSAFQHVLERYDAETDVKIKSAFNRVGR